MRPVVYYRTARASPLPKSLPEDLNAVYTEVYKSASGVGAGLNYYGQTNRGKVGFTTNQLTLTNRFKKVR